jgi:TolB protein
MRTIWKSILMAVLLSASVQSNALLNLELTQGVKAALPIAFVPFSGESDLPEDGQLSLIIQHDLTLSGEFKLITGKALPAEPHSIQEIKLSQWRQLGVEYVVVGAVKALGHDQYQVTMSLLNLYLTHDKPTLSEKNVLFSKVYTVKATQLRQLAHKLSDLIYHSLTGVHGVFSTQLAYVVVTPNPGKDKFQLTVSDYDGYQPRVLVNSSEPIMSPAWSPDKKFIAFTSFKNKFPSIYTANVGTGKLEEVTEARGMNGAPAWSADGSSLAYVSSPTGQAKIYIQSLSSGKMTQLTHGYSIDTEPSFSPDGNSLIFTSNRGGSPQIYQYDLKKKKVERLTFDGSYNTSASFAQSGNELVLLHREKRQYYVALQDLDTDNLHVVTKSGLAESPSFAPNGKMIIYTTMQKGKAVLAIVSTDGQVQIQLPESVGSAQEPAWSPF